MRQHLNHALRLGAVLAVGSLLAIGSGSVAEGQEPPAISATINVVPASTAPGTVVTATATFTNLGGAPDPPWLIGVDMFNDAGAGTFDPTSITESGVTGCTLLDPRSLFCNGWTPTTAGETATISVNIIVDDAAPASPGWTIEAYEDVDTLAETNLEIVAAPPVTTPVTTTVEPPAVNPPASGGTTTAAPTQLPATGASMWPFVLIGFLTLAAGAGALRLSRSD